MNCLNINASTGEITQTDTAYVTVPISAIREANQKLIEREYLIKQSAIKDSIINIQDGEISLLNKQKDEYKVKNKKLKKRARRGISITTIIAALTTAGFILK